MSRRARSLIAVDLFCGAGGASTGLALAAEALGLHLDLLAINHWPVAIASHEANHPWARHLCKSLHEVDPRKAVPGGRVHLLVASPECTHHSIARGGRPVNDQMRISAWQIVDWLAALYVDAVLVENVREFRDWGPVGVGGRPIRARRGDTYRAWKEAIASLGYTLDERVLNAADYGDPTTRERLFLIGRRRGRPGWPAPTHDATGLLTGNRWRPAAEILDRALVGESIFNRRRPLSANTMRRIFAGLRKYCGVRFVMPVNHGPERRTRSVDQPLPTLTARANQYLAEPLLVTLRGTAPEQLDRSARPVNAPVPTQATARHLGLAVGAGGPRGAAQPQATDAPLGTVLAENHRGVATPFLVPFFGERPTQTPRTHALGDPLPAVTSHGAGALAEPVIVSVNHGGGDETRRQHTTRAPLPTVTASPSFAVAEAFLLKYSRTGGARSVTQPVDTLTTKARYALVEIAGEVNALDVRFRMLQVHELAAAMGFPVGYKFAGTRKQQIRQVGNAVAVNTARALCAAILTDLAGVWRRPRAHAR